MTIASRRDSFCGKMSACNNLRQYGIPYSITTLHTESPDSPEFTRDLEWFAGACRVVNGFRNLRVGAIGARPTAFNTVRYSEKILESHGISIETLDLSEVLGRIERTKDNDDMAQAKLAAIKKYVDASSVPEAALLKMAKLGAVVDQWMTATEVAISAVLPCQRLLPLGADPLEKPAHAALRQVVAMSRAAGRDERSAPGARPVRAEIVAAAGRARHACAQAGFLHSLGFARLEQ